MKGFFREFGETPRLLKKFWRYSGMRFRPFKEIFVAKAKHPRIRRIS